MVERQLPKLNMRVRFPLPAPNKKALKVLIFQYFQGFLFAHVRRLICLKTPAFACLGGVKGGVTKFLYRGPCLDFHYEYKFKLPECTPKQGLSVLTRSIHSIVQSLNSLPQEARDLCPEGTGVFREASQLSQNAPHNNQRTEQNIIIGLLAQIIPVLRQCSIIQFSHAVHGQVDNWNSGKLNILGLLGTIGSCIFCRSGVFYRAFTDLSRSRKRKPSLHKVGHDLPGETPAAPTAAAGWACPSPAPSPKPAVAALPSRWRRICSPCRFPSRLPISVRQKNFQPYKE